MRNYSLFQCGGAGSGKLEAGIFDLHDSGSRPCSES